MIYEGDCLEILKTLPDDSVDSVVTDPPYELGFMGKAWDKTGIAYNVDMWKEVLRVLKPGGYLLSFGSTRTYHRMAYAIEDAGFEIRDMVEWMYGSGFPKSLNIGKAIDKLQGNEREISSHYIAPDGQWRDCNNHKPNEEIRNPETHYGYKTSGFRPIDKGNSEWEGWGTALKPAHEPICMARKPLSEKTVAENVLKWGTGGINIDGCRIKTTKEDIAERAKREGTSISKLKIYGSIAGKVNHAQFSIEQGRFPANLIHDGSEEVLGLFPANAPGLSGGGAKDNKKTGNETIPMFNRKPSAPFIRGDNGSAARFFYCAKASKSERDAGCEGMEEVLCGMMEDDSYPIKTGSGNLRETKRHNNHPTVKPLALMRYLCRLVTPFGGLILDPFMGSGSTGMAAKQERFEFIGIELEKENCQISEKRIENVQPFLMAIGQI